MADKFYRFFILNSSSFSFKPSLIQKTNTCSFQNIKTMSFLRHFNNKLIESPYEDTDLFKHDASFYLHELAPDYVWLSCTNPGMENFSIYYDSKTHSYVLDKDKYATFFLYTFEEMKLGMLVLERCDLMERRLLTNRF